MLLLASCGSGGERPSVAYFTVSSDNTWLQASVVEMRSGAEREGIDLVEFDAAFDSVLQREQLRQVIATGQFDGMILVSLNGAELIPDVETAIASGLEVVVLNQVLGDDLTTADPQVDGIAASVLVPPQLQGERLGDLTLQACAGLDPCNVAYFHSILGSTLDTAIRAGWDEAVASSPIRVVATAEGRASAAEGLTEMQRVLDETTDLHIVIGFDQSMQGAEFGLSEADLLDEVRIIGLGGSSHAIDAIADGRWWGGVYGAPATEGRLAIEAMVGALDGLALGGIDPALSAPDGGMMTPANIGVFEAQWDG